MPASFTTIIVRRVSEPQRAVPRKTGVRAPSRRHEARTPHHRPMSPHVKQMQRERLILSFTLARMASNTRGRRKISGLLALRSAELPVGARRIGQAAVSLRCGTRCYGASDMGVALNPGRTSSASKAQNSSWMLSGSRNTRTGPACSSCMPEWATPCSSRCLPMLREQLGRGLSGRGGPDRQRVHRTCR